KVKETMMNPFAYAGEMYDKESGFYYLRARYYDPKMGRFVSEDTVKGQVDNPLSLNRYTYVENNPLRYVDPTGHIKDSFGRELNIATDPNKAAANIKEAQEKWKWTQGVIDKAKTAAEKQMWKDYQASMHAWAERQRSVVGVAATLYLKGGTSASLFAGGGLEIELSGNKLQFIAKGNVSGKTGASIGVTTGVKMTNDLNNDMSNITGNIGVGFGEGIIAEGGFKTDGKYIELSYGGGVGAAAEVTLIPIDVNFESEGKYEITMPFNLGHRGGLIPKYDGSPSYSEWMNIFRGNGW
ncbi:RHS repeat-associated core domain-containing protein, partial [Brevibacillus agri]